MCFFFFFQAEDGIRDVAVTGVQTCALPILPRLDRVGVGRNAVAPLDLDPVMVADETERHHGDRGDRGPDYFRARVAVRVKRLATRTVPVLDGEPDQPDLDEHERDAGDD